MANIGDTNVERLLTLAASSASVEEQANSALKDGRFPDGSKPVTVEKRIWRAQVKSQYIEPEVDIDPSEMRSRHTCRNLTHYTSVRFQIQEESVDLP